MLVFAAISVVLSGCAQSGALLNVTTGALDPQRKTQDAEIRNGVPPLPSRRVEKKPSETTDGSLFAALPDIDLSAPAVAPRSVMSEDTLANVYIRIARGIRRCWLGPDEPKLPGHGFRAEAKPGRSGQAEIDVYKKVEGRKLGPFVFEVTIEPQSGGARVRSTNRRLDAKLANSLRADIARWTRGQEDCGTARAKST